MFAPPRSLSQLTTSFIGSQCQGIRPAPFLAWPFSFAWDFSVSCLDSPFANKKICKIVSFLDNFTNLILFLQNYSVFKVQISLRSPCPLSYFVRKAQTTRPSLYKDYTSYNRLSPVSRPSHFCVAEIILESYAVYPIILRIIESQLEVFFLLFREDGGPKWTRTIDLSIISRVL